MRKFKFTHRGGLAGKVAFVLHGNEGLRRKVRELQRSGAIFTGATLVERVEGRNWQVSYFDGSSQCYNSESLALVAFIEDRTESRLMP